MPVKVKQGAPTLFIRKDAYERAGIVRRAIDERLGLTDDEFHVEGDLIVIGPIYEDEALSAFIADLEGAGLNHFEDFFDLSGNWPEWLDLIANSTAP
jgi:hypothetical protein